MQPHHVHERTPLPATSSPEAALVAGWLTASAVGAAWLALASATGLIYHFAPGAPFAAAAFAYRWRSGGGRVPGGRVAALLLGAAAATAAALLALHAAAHPLDAPAVTAVVAAVGAAASAIWLRRGATLDAGR